MPSGLGAAAAAAASSSHSSRDAAGFGHHDVSSFERLMNAFNELREDVKRVEDKVDGMIELGQQRADKLSDTVREIDDRLRSVVSR